MRQVQWYHDNEGRTLICHSCIEMAASGLLKLMSGGMRPFSTTIVDFIKPAIPLTASSCLLMDFTAPT